MKFLTRASLAALCFAGVMTAAPLRAQNSDSALPIGQRTTTDFGDAKATSVNTPSGISTTLTDPSGNQLGTLVWDYAANSLVWDITGVGTTNETIDGGTSTLGGSNYALYYIYKNTMYAVSLNRSSGGPSVNDNPGCDWFPDPLETPCIRACCDAHDACYAAQSPPCTWKSWIPFVGSSACKKCNRDVVKCIAKCVKKAIIGIIIPKDN